MLMAILCRGDKDDNSKYEYENLANDVYSSNTTKDRPYLNRAYVDRIYQESRKGVITVEKGMLFASVEDFMEVLRDYVILEIARIKNKKTRITAMWASKRCEWYLHAIINLDEATSKIKVYRAKHTYVKALLIPL